VAASRRHPLLGYPRQEVSGRPGGIFAVNVGYGTLGSSRRCGNSSRPSPSIPPCTARIPRGGAGDPPGGDRARGPVHRPVVDSGSEANEATFKLVRQYHRQTGNPGKYKIPLPLLSYHGPRGNAMSAGGWLPETLYEPTSVGFFQTYPPYCYRCRMRRPTRTARSSAPGRCGPPSNGRIPAPSRR